MAASEGLRLRIFERAGACLHTYPGRATTDYNEVCRSCIRILQSRLCVQRIVAEKKSDLGLQ